MDRAWHDDKVVGVGDYSVKELTCFETHQVLKYHSLPFTLQIEHKDKSCRELCCKKVTTCCKNDKQAKSKESADCTSFIISKLIRLGVLLVSIIS